MMFLFVPDGGTSDKSLVRPTAQMHVANLDDSSSESSGRSFVILRNTKTADGGHILLRTDTIKKAKNGVRLDENDTTPSATLVSNNHRQLLLHSQQGVLVHSVKRLPSGTILLLGGNSGGGEGGHILIQTSQAAQSNPSRNREEEQQRRGSVEGGGDDILVKALKAIEEGGSKSGGGADTTGGSGCVRAAPCTSGE
ncbi:unnamed protein product [Acanthoscelides obtectus]|uniref:Uncharacterized protein n=1 Tax=Acanthoscelides obtectus TaxID=200917 RepID=A0A9P0MCC6_ACAOB|nr:unnamed protein product [Acanthoscelides obtectus]CAK1655669.1 hypothetical protein AOBTE_LOCUS19248 [Acanthoscelides obtectus]